MKNRCESLKLVSKKDGRNGTLVSICLNHSNQKNRTIPFQTICCCGKFSTEMTFEVRSVPVTNVYFSNQNFQKHLVMVNLAYL